MKKRKITTLLSKCLFEPTIFVQYHVDVIIYHAAISYDPIQFYYIHSFVNTIILFSENVLKTIVESVIIFSDVRGVIKGNGPMPPALSKRAFSYQ